MAKTIKKNSKSSNQKATKKRKTPTEAPEQRKVAPQLDEGLISLAMSKEDMSTFANLMAIVAKTFEKLAMQAAQENDDATFNVLQARHRLSAIFAQKLVESVRMPEPISRDFH